MRNSRRPSASQAWLLPIAVGVAIGLASSQSAVAAPNISHIDKVTHFLVFGLLATLIARIDSVARWPVLGRGWAAVLASVYGFLDEFHQSFTPGRMVEVGDGLADAAGAIVAVVLYERWAWYRSGLETPLWPPKQRVETGLGPVSDHPA